MVIDDLSKVTVGAGLTVNVKVFDETSLLQPGAAGVVTVIVVGSKT